MSIMAPISAITRGSLHDGKGVRTVVYLKGCNLRCRWCHNPETWQSTPDLLFAPQRCIGCGRCVEICPQQHVVSNGKMHLLREGCTVCGSCAQVCPTGALSPRGEMQDVRSVFEQVKRDTIYYRATGGGVTISGGECLLYPEFMQSLLQLCREADIDTAVETALHVPIQNVMQVAPWTQWIFADLKIADDDRHRLYTGSTNKQILQNLQWLTHNHDRVTVRIPVIPGVNDSEADLTLFAEILSAPGPGLIGVELLPYNVLGEAKYKLMGKMWESFATQSQTPEQMTALCHRLQAKLPPNIPVFCRAYP